jgi:hypothetical protein
MVLVDITRHFFERVASDNSLIFTVLFSYTIELDRHWRAGLLYIILFDGNDMSIID